MVFVSSHGRRIKPSIMWGRELDHRRQAVQFADTFTLGRFADPGLIWAILIWS